MKKFFSILAASTLATVSLGSGAFAGNTFDDHQNLWNTLESAGVEMFVNDPKFCKDNWGGGAYVMNESQRKSAMMICQDNGKSVGADNQADWTENDLDSLRHEAHHVVQDCLDGNIADENLVLFFDEAKDHRAFVKNGLSPQMIQAIIKSYSKEVVLLELEAFAVAANVDASDIADAVETFCKA